MNELEYINHNNAWDLHSKNHVLFSSYHFITYFLIYMGLLLVPPFVSFIYLLLGKCSIVLSTTVFVESFTIWRNKNALHLMFFKPIGKFLAFHSSMSIFGTAFQVPHKKNHSYIHICVGGWEFIYMDWKYWVGQKVLRVFPLKNHKFLVPVKMEV